MTSGALAEPWRDGVDDAPRIITGSVDLRSDGSGSVRPAAVTRTISWMISSAET
jgi:hypothetical protein